MRRWIAVPLSLAVVVALHAQVNVLTANYDTRRTNSNPNETILNTSNVNVQQFGKIISLPVDGQIYAQPLYVGGVSIPGQGVRNVVYVATMHNSVYAFDADSTAAIAPLWKTNLGPAVPTATFDEPGFFDPYNNITPENGILGTPVIDPASQTIYLVADTYANGTYAFVLHALDITTGLERPDGPSTIQAKVAGTADDQLNGFLSLVPGELLQRPGLLLLNGVVYIAFGSHGDELPYHGWALGYSASNIQEQVTAFCTTPNGDMGSIWQAGRGLATDGQGNIYAVTANGDYDGITNFSQSFLKFATTPAFSLSDWFTPDDWQALSDADLDLGATGPVLIPGTTLIAGAGKEGVVYVLDTTAPMGHLQPGNPQLVQSFSAVAYHGVPPSLAVWISAEGPILYMAGWNDSVKAYQISNGIFNTSPVSQAADVGGYEEGIAVSSSGGAAGTGILWVTAAGATSAGTLYAYDASDLSTELWDSGMNGTADRLGNFAKFSPPTVVNGKVYVATFSNQLAVYGLRSTGGNAGDIAVMNAASYDPSFVAPGELVTIFGNAIGPQQPVGLQLDSSGNVETQSGGVQVLFDSTPAPLIYVSANQVSAIVPYSVAGEDLTQVQVISGTQRSNRVALPVAPATPAIFSADSTGYGQGAILNQDGSVNSQSNPAAAGSVISLFATGGGETNPPDDDEITPNGSPPATVLPVSVTIDGQIAEVEYAGAAPGLVAGVLQVNAKIPDNVIPDNAVAVVLWISGVSSPVVTVAVN
jgi:uncharacterized protein (TIGR03437 family)